MRMSVAYHRGGSADTQIYPTAGDGSCRRARVCPSVPGSRRGEGSMVLRPAAPEPAPSAEAVEFVRFCYERKKVGWPELYDEMCGVAGRGLFRGWGADDLA